MTTAPGPVPTPVPRTTPENLTVGEGLGWIIPPLGEITYLAWARNRTFIVGDTLGKEERCRFGITSLFEQERATIFDLP